MPVGFVRPLQGRDPLPGPIRGLSPTAIHIHPRRGWEMHPNVQSNGGEVTVGASLFPTAWIRPSSPRRLEFLVAAT